MIAARDPLPDPPLFRGREETGALRLGGSSISPLPPDTAAAAMLARALTGFDRATDLVSFEGIAPIRGAIAR
jgi:hypothetical protein